MAGLHVSGPYWPRGTHLLDVLRAAGLDVPFSACTIGAVRVTMTRTGVLENEDLAEERVLGCQELPETDGVAVTYDE